jgi:iron complex outermembrane receptor protein
LSYVTVSTGFKAGGFNDLTNPGPVLANYYTYAPEYVTNYELGLKSRFLDNSATLNVALFYEDYTSIQESQNIQESVITTNAASAGIYGAEVEGSWKVTDEDRVDAFVNILHATFTNYLNAINGQTTQIVPSLDGNDLPDAPEFSLRLQYGHDFELPNGGLLVPSAAIYWQSKSYLREFNLPIDLVPAYTKTTLRLTYQDPTGHWEGDAYVDNIENNVIRVGEETVVGNYLSFYGTPRTFGARISYHY